MATWAGVQKVSRPMDLCQEMSHWPPIIAEETPKTAHHTYHGTRSAAVRTAAAVTDGIAVAEVVAILSLCTFTIIAFLALAHAPGVLKFSNGTQFRRKKAAAAKMGRPAT